MRIETVKRVFSYGGRMLEDLAPNESATRSMMVYQDLFPELCRCIAMPAEVKPLDGVWVYEVIKIA